ncbi:sensor histidine kinase [Streptomyces chrestomyceticus]|uniref:sensor histidine kinase n=1 Tax=Streptomyces chrestomyceticus TaxID=68185 RepID=UPI0033C8C65B
MGERVKAEGRKRRVWCAVLVVVVLSPALGASVSALPLALCAAVAVAVAVLGRAVWRVSFAQGAGFAAGLSLVLDFGYFGDPKAVGFWLPFEGVALLVLLYRVTRREPAPQVGWVGGLVGAAAVCLLLRVTLHMPEQGWRGSVVGVLLGFFPAACVAGVGLYLRAVDGRRARAVAEALRGQRLEVARDLHDFVAHEVTGMVLEAQAAQLDRSAPAETRELFERIEGAGLRALDSMDQTVRALRQAEGSGVDTEKEKGWVEVPRTRVYGLGDLGELVGRFSSMSSAETRLSQGEGLAGVLSREAEDAAYRVVLESLTNVRRHAPRATRVVVEVRRTDEGSVEVTVVDDGGGGSSGSSGGGIGGGAFGGGGVFGGGRRGGGTGLAGLSGRVGALGGVFWAGPYDGGWRVGCAFPAGEVG